jgi:hypothetical protein
MVFGRFQDIADTLNTGLMPSYTAESTLFGPAIIAVHNNGNMFERMSGI